MVHRETSGVRDARDDPGRGDPRAPGHRLPARRHTRLARLLGPTRYVQGLHQGQELPEVRQRRSHHLGCHCVLRTRLFQLLRHGLVQGYQTRLGFVDPSLGSIYQPFLQMSFLFMHTNFNSI